MTLSATPDARRRAGARWQALKERLLSVSPQALLRGLIAAGVIGLAAGFSVATWPTLLPFLAGAIIAYTVLPIANRLDRFMPRVLAAILAELVAVAILGGVLLVVVPPLLNGLLRVALVLPTAEQVRAWLDGLEGRLGQLPDPLGGILLAVATEASGNLQQTLSGFVEGAGAFVTSQILGIFGTASFLLGLLVIPAWVLTIVADERSIKRRGATLIAPAIRGDVYALFRIADRALGTFLRVRVLLGIVTASFIWVGLMIAGQLDLGPFPFAVTAAVLLGVLQLIPELGFYLGFLPILLVLVIGGPVPAATMAVVYVLSARAASNLVETRVSRGVLDVHPGIMIPAIVVLSEFGLVWLFAAAPLVAIVRDLVRYAAGRLDDPPAPANVLPGESVRRGAIAGVAGVALPLPSVYRDRVSRLPAGVPGSRGSGPGAVAPVPAFTLPAARAYPFTPATPKPSTTVTVRSPQS